MSAPKMSKSHYVFLARVIFHAGRTLEGRTSLGRIFAEALRATSPTFDARRFMAGCVWGGES